ncbi:MAG: hypothetical protein ACLU8F_06235 [Clostridia bacterium]
MEKIRKIKEIKYTKGITMVALVITIIMLLILTSVTLYVGTDQIQKAEDNKLLTELGMVQHAVLEQYSKYTMTKVEADLVGTPVEASELTAISAELNITFVMRDGYYKVTPENAVNMGIKDAEDTYIVNYKTGEVLNLTKKKTKSGQVLYQKAISQVQS